MIRTYSDLRSLSTLEERYEYLALRGVVGESTFGFDRWMNQLFYRSSEWRRVRDYVIARDEGFDLGIDDVPLRGVPYVHHMNSLTQQDIEDATDNMLDPEYLITCSLTTHNAIHYGDIRQLPQPYVERRPGDTVPWR